MNTDFTSRFEAPVANVSRDLLRRALEPIWYSKPETASRVRRRIENVLSFATGLGYRSGDNPAAWSGNLSLVFPERSQVRKLVHHRALPYAEMPVFMSELRQREGIAARAVEFLILTAARTSEVTGAAWAEIDFGKRIWTVPARRMKAGREHKVPLSDATISLLNGLPREVENPYLFVGPRKDGLSNMAMDAVLRRMGIKDRATIHGFRSSFRDWAAEETDFQNHVVEAALAHTIGDRVEAAYRRGDLLEKRRQLMEAWVLFCDRPAVSRKQVSVSRAA